LASVVPVSLTSIVELPPKSALVIPFEISADKLAAGTYELAVQPTGWTSNRRIVVDFELSFELRETDTLSTSLDLHYRRAVEHLLAGAFQQADAEASTMIALYPQCSVAYALRGEIARRLGKQDDSTRADLISRQLRESGSDELLTRSERTRPREIR
jgi:hypothetical protein